MKRLALRRRPPEATLSWLTTPVGKPRRLVLRRWARPESLVEHPDITAEREAAVIDHLSGDEPAA